MRAFIISLLLVVGLQAQPWGGQRLIFGTTYLDTDETLLAVSGMTDTLMKDTLYTEALPIKKSTGIYGVTAYMDSVSLTRIADTLSVSLDVRFLAVFAPKPQQRSFATSYTPRVKKVTKSPWINLLEIAETDTLYTLGIASADSTWWIPTYNYLQYRLRSTVADTVFHNVMEFRDAE